MFRRFITIAGMVALAQSTMLADFSYQETTKITGGSLIAALKVVGVFSKQARQMGDPIQSTVAVKGDRMVHRSPQHTTVIDLASQTITSIDPQKKTYSVITFEEMKQAMEQMSQKMQQQQKNGDQGEMKFKVSANNTGKTKQINGLEAKEMVLKMEMEGTDQKSGQTGSMVVVADTWIAPAVPGYNEVRDFYRRMAEKINWAPGGNMFMNRPDVVEGMAEVYKESAKLDGMPVFQTMTMGAEGTVPADGSSPQPAAQQQQPPPDRPSVGGAIGGALGGKFGLGRKKPQQDTQPAPASGSQSSGGAQSSGALLESTTEMSAFSSNPVDSSQFEIPAGFKKVEADLKRGVQ
ncbi:MAG: hypothetical protein LAQ69_26740 [Acidobacteriia bacterium]|nr:hypothetical protein [Terriglobia bacterium]